PRIGPERRGKTLNRLTKLERVQQRHRAVELRLRGRRARCLEVHGAELLLRRGVLMLLREWGDREQRDGRREPGQLPVNDGHGSPPLSGIDAIISQLTNYSNTAPRHQMAR